MTYQPLLSKCRSCGAEIFWAITPTGKRAPIDAKPERRFILHPGEDNVLRASIQLTYQSHYATCPQAKYWRSKATSPSVTSGAEARGSEGARPPRAAQDLDDGEVASCPECGGSKAVRLVSHTTGWPIGPGGVCGNPFHGEGVFR
jgi:hypothetical protein